MKLLSIRKIILLSAIAVLTIVYILQLVLGRPADIREFVLETEPDAIEISGGQTGTVHLVRDNGGWVINDERYPADSGAVSAMLDVLETVRAPGRVSGNPQSGDFGFETPLEVAAYASGRKLRTIHAGKVSANSMQTYCLIDESDDVYLVSGNLRNIFDRTVENLRDKSVYTLHSDAIERAEFTGPAASDGWILERNGIPAAWHFSDSDRIPDAETVAAWIRSVASLRAQEYAPENIAVPERPLGTLSLIAGGQTISVTVHKKDEKNGSYLCSSSALPYVFHVSSYVGERLVRDRESFYR